MKIKYTLYFLLLLIVSCAKKGQITGGAKDTLAPVLVKSQPNNYSTNFTGNTIRIDFSELIRVKDVNKQLIISPPLKKQPVIIPQGSASKYINIKIQDTLKPNTTYTFNFGNSISDNNEGNPFTQFKYVLSTGSVIDSLKMSGKISDSFEQQLEDNVHIMLYDAATYKDSLVYKQQPLYVAQSLYKSGLFKLENIKGGKYKVIALLDKNKNYTYQRNTDKIGFLDNEINLPKDSVVALKVFRESKKFKSTRPVQESRYKYFVGVEGDKEEVQIKSLNPAFKVYSTFYKEKSDSLQLFIPKGVKDSLEIEVSKGSELKKYVLKPKEMKLIDTLMVEFVQGKKLLFKENIGYKVSTPIAKLDASKIIISNKKGAKISFETKQDDFNQLVELNFEKEENEKYKIELLPGAIEDIYQSKNDTLKSEFTQPALTDFGNLKLKIGNLKNIPAMVELLNSANQVITSVYLENKNEHFFEGIQPSLYTVRLYYDENRNKKWDSGDFLNHKQAEEIIYMPGQLDVRANWDVDQEFELKD